MRSNEAIVFLGPGRSGTTSLYHAFRQSRTYQLTKEKESSAFGTSFSSYAAEIERMRASGIVVDLTPSNLLASDMVVKNTESVGFDAVTYIVIQRNAMARLKSLYFHHLKLGTISDSFQEYVEKSHETARASSRGWDGSEDLTHWGLCEYNPELLDNFRGKNLKVVAYDQLFVDVNNILLELELPNIEEVIRNRSYNPRWPYLNKIVLLAYRRLRLHKLNGLDRLKRIYISASTQPPSVPVSSEVLDLIAKYEDAWRDSLSRLEATNPSTL